MSNKKIKYFLLLILCISICTLNLNAQYIPSFSFDTNLCLSQNRTLKNNDLPLRTSGNFELRLKPVAFRFNNNLIVDWDFSIATNSQTAVWHNTVLLGFNTIGTSVMLVLNLISMPSPLALVLMQASTTMKTLISSHFPLSLITSSF